jgi:hypothetical protein
MRMEDSSDDDLLDRFFQPAFNGKFPLKRAKKIQDSDYLFCCGFPSCKDRDPFQRRRGAREHYSRFHKDDLLELENNKMEVPPIRLKARKPSSSTSSSTTAKPKPLPVQMVYEEDEEDDEYIGSDDTEDDFNMPLELPKKRSRSTKKPTAASTTTKGKKTNDLTLDDPEYVAAVQQAEKVKKAAMRKKTLNAKNAEVATLHGEIHREEKIEELDHTLEQAKVKMLYEMQEFLNYGNELLASAVTIVNVQHEDNAKIKKNIQDVVVGGHAHFSSRAEKLDREHFITNTQGVLSNVIEPKITNHESIITGMKHELKRDTDDFLKQFDTFHQDEQLLLNFAKDSRGDKLKRGLNFAHVFYLNFLLLVG